MFLCWLLIVGGWLSVVLWCMLCVVLLVLLLVVCCVLFDVQYSVCVVCVCLFVAWPLFVVLLPLSCVSCCLVRVICLLVFFRVRIVFFLKIIFVCFLFVVGRGWFVVDRCFMRVASCW